MVSASSKPGVIGAVNSRPRCVLSLRWLLRSPCFAYPEEVPGSHTEEFPTRYQIVSSTAMVATVVFNASPSYSSTDTFTTPPRRVAPVQKHSHTAGECLHHPCKSPNERKRRNIHNGVINLRNTCQLYRKYSNDRCLLDGSQLQLTSLWKIVKNSRNISQILK
jgi:hypothetical protein